MAQGAFNLHFPVGGLNRRYGFQHQPPYTTSSCLNVRPDGQPEGRERGGSRPGLEYAYNFEDDASPPVAVTRMGGANNKTRLLNRVGVADSNGFTVWDDQFENDTLDDIWVRAAWDDGANVGRYELPEVFIEDDTSALVLNEKVGVYRDTVHSPWDRSLKYAVTMHIRPYTIPSQEVESHHGIYSIFFLMDGASDSPNPRNNGARAELEMTGTDGSGICRLVVRSLSGAHIYTITETFTSDNGIAEEGEFQVQVTDGDTTDPTIVVTWRGDTLINTTAIAALGPTNDDADATWGFGAECTNFGGVCLIGNVRIEYYTGTAIVDRPVLVASAGGLLYRNLDSVSTLGQLSTNVSLSSDDNLESVQRFQKLYIADFSAVIVEGVDGTLSGGGLILASATVPNFQASYPELDTDDYVVVLTNATGGAINGTYQIAALGSSLTLSRDAGENGGLAAFKIFRAPKIYDPGLDTLTIWDTTAQTGEDQVPSGCPLIARYRDRLVLAGEPGYVFYMSRRGDPLDFDFGAADDDEDRAVGGLGNTDAVISEPLTALIVGSDDYLLFGCEHSLHILRGDLTRGGVIDEISSEIGVAVRGGWCRGPEGDVFFLSRDGMYGLRPGASSYPISMSRERMPNELINLRAGSEVAMAYDVYDRGIHILLPPTDGITGKHWWFDWETKGYWPVVFSGSATAALSNEPSVVFADRSYLPSENSVLIGGRSGRIFRLHRLKGKDTSYSFATHVDYGPFRLGKGNMEGILNELVGVVGDHLNHASVIQYSIFVGESQQEAVQKAAIGIADYSGTWQKGRVNYTARPRLRGFAFVLRIGRGVVNDLLWQIEEVRGAILPAGKQRLL